MKVLVSGKHYSIGSSLTSYIEEQFNDFQKKYSLNITTAEAVFNKEGYFYHCDILIHDSGLGIIKASYNLDEVYSSFDSALTRIEKQLRKHKKKIIDKHHKIARKELNHVEEYVPATKYILSAEVSEDDHIESIPITIAEKATNIERLSVSEAIMKMDLAHLPALLFINKANDRMNVVYYRKDGNISWVDPENK